MVDCLFCKIIAGDIPADKVYEDEEFLAFQALHQSSPGHTLVIPKEHSEDLLDMDSELGSKCLAVLQKVANAMMEGLPCDGFNIGVNTRAEAGQVIFHTHVHIIPRRKDDGLGNWPEHPTTDEERALFAEKIISKL